MSRASWNYVAQHLGQGVGAGIQKVTEKYLEDEKKKKALEVYEDPNSTPVQKVMALESISPGKGANIYETIFKEDQAKKAAANNAIINDELNGIAPPPQQDVGQRAEVGALPNVTPQYSPVETANNIQGPGTGNIGPQPSPGLVGPEPVTPEAQQMIQNAQAQQQTAQGQQNGPPQQEPLSIRNAPIEKLQEWLGKTTDKGTIRQLKSAIHQRQEDAANRTKYASALVKGDVDKAKEDRAEIRKFAEPYENLPKIDKIVRNLEDVENIVLNSEEFSADETTLRTIVTGLAEGKNHDQIAELMKTDAQQKMFYLTYDLIAPKELGGSNPSTKEVFLSMAKNVNQYKGKAANAFIAQKSLAEAKTGQFMARTIAKLRVDEPNLSAAEFKQAVAQIVDPQAALYQEEANNKITYVEAQEFVKKTPAPAGTVWMLGKKDKKVKPVPVNLAPSLQAQGNILLHE